MSFDAFACAAIAAELRDSLPAGRVQHVTQINSLTYGFEIYVHPARRYLVISVDPQAPHLYLTAARVRRGTGHHTPLMLVLRKYLRGARLQKVEQPLFERLLYLYFTGPFGPVILAVEMLGTRSNLLLLEPDRTILGVARLVRPPADSRRRTLIPNQPYRPPAAPDRLLPPALTEYTLRRELSEASPELPLTRFLPGIVQGVSPLLAREIVYRATGSVDTPVAHLTTLAPFLEVFHQQVNRLKQNVWQPTLASDEDGNPVAFAPYPLHHLPHTRPFGDFSGVVEAYFAGVAAGYAAAKAPLQAAITQARDRLARRRERLAGDEAAQANPAAFKQKGEAILAYAHQIQPGQTTLTVEWVPGAAPLSITLNPALSPADNARQYFNRYRKAQRAAKEIPAQYKHILLAEQYLDQLEQDLEMAENRPEIDAIAAALAEAGYYRSGEKRKKQQKRAAARFLRLTAPEGATVWAGKNALQNAHLTFTRAAPDDLWLHARDVPGAHVIIPTAQGLPSEADVFWAAGIAAYYSRGRHDTAVEVDVTLKKYVRAVKGAAPGLVTYRNQTTLRVTPHPPDME